jgi:hypothetical protein
MKKHQLPDLPTMRTALDRIAAAGGTMLLSGRPGFSAAGLMAAHAYQRSVTQGLSAEDRLTTLAYMALECVEFDDARRRAGLRSGFVQVPVVGEIGAAECA